MQKINIKQVVQSNPRYSDSLSGETGTIKDFCVLLGIEEADIEHISVGDTIATLSGLKLVGESSDTNDEIEEPFYSLFYDLNEQRDAQDQEELNDAQAWNLWRKAPGISTVSLVDRNEFDNPGMYSEIGIVYYFTDDTPALLEFMKRNMAVDVDLNQIEDEDFLA